jgi:hypothetical protein
MRILIKAHESCILCADTPPKFALGKKQWQRVIPET